MTCVTTEIVYVYRGTCLCIHYAIDRHSIYKSDGQLRKSTDTLIRRRTELFITTINRKFSPWAATTRPHAHPHSLFLSLSLSLSFNHALISVTALTEREGKFTFFIYMALPRVVNRESRCTIHSNIVLVKIAAETSRQRLASDRCGHRDFPKVFSPSLNCNRLNWILTIPITKSYKSRISKSNSRHFRGARN